MNCFKILSTNAFLFIAGKPRGKELVAAKGTTCIKKRVRSRSASLEHCVLRKRISVSTPCSWDRHPGLHSSTADSAVPVHCASSLGPQRYRSCILVASKDCRARLVYEKYVSASPCHPRMRVDLLSCISMNLPFPKWTAVRFAFILVRVVRQTITYQFTKYSTKGCACSNVSRSPTVADVRVQKVKADDKLTFPHHKGQVLL